ncbi:MAG: hypothetical protein AAF543_23040, partial [Pseudomonadota bacterium]
WRGPRDSVFLVIRRVLNGFGLIHIPRGKALSFRCLRLFTGIARGNTGRNVLLGLALKARERRSAIVLGRLITASNM